MATKLLLPKSNEMVEEEKKEKKRNEIKKYFVT